MKPKHQTLDASLFPVLGGRTYLKLSWSCRFRTKLSALRYTLFWDCATCRLNRVE